MSEAETGEFARDLPDTASAPVDTVDNKGEREMPCPACGAIMPDLKGGKASICPNCGFKDSCCY